MTTDNSFSTLSWGATDLTKIPNMVTSAPGPLSREWHDRCTRYFKGLSGQVKLFPVSFESGQGCVLRDVDGNEYIDFSSGIYVTTLGHCHPKISEAIARAAHQLMNAHDFTTPIKTELMEKLAEVLPGDLSGFQLYDFAFHLGLLILSRVILGVFTQIAKGTRGGDQFGNLGTAGGFQILQTVF